MFHTKASKISKNIAVIVVVVMKKSDIAKHIFHVNVDAISGISYRRNLMPSGRMEISYRVRGTPMS